MSHLAPKKIDIVVPVRNAGAEIGAFIAEVERLNLPPGVKLGFVFVEDSSTDDTLDVLRRTAKSARNVSYYSLCRGFGEGPAVFFGMSQSQADAVITMEAGGGHPPAKIPEMIARYLEGAEIVQAVRQAYRVRSRMRSAGTAVVNALLRFIAGFDAHMQNVYFRLLSRAQKERLLLNKRCITSLRFAFPSSDARFAAFVFFDAQDRNPGQSTYSFWRLVRLSADFILSVIPVSRLAVLLSLGLLASFFIGGPIGLILLLGTATVAAKTWSLWTNRILESLEIREVHLAGDSEKDDYE